MTALVIIVLVSAAVGGGLGRFWAARRTYRYSYDPLEPAFYNDSKDPKWITRQQRRIRRFTGKSAVAGGVAAVIVLFYLAR